MAASAVPNAVNETLANNLRQHWNEGEIVDILGVIILFGCLNRWNDSMGTHLKADAMALGKQQLANHGWNTRQTRLSRHP